MLKLEKNVLIANTGEDTLTFVNRNDERIMGIINLQSFGNYPIGPYELLSIDDTFVYCINIYENSLYKINLKRKKVVDRLYTGTSPSCIDYFDNHLYVVNTDSNSISVIDMKNFSIVESIPVEEKPVDMIVDKQNKKIYVANSNSSSISIINLVNDKMETIKLSSNPLKIILEKRKIYILTSVDSAFINRSNIILWDLEKSKEEELVKLKGIFNTMIKINSSEIVFATNMGNGCLYRVDIRKNNILKKTNLSGLPNKLVWDKNRFLYITNLSTNTLSIFDIKTSKIITNIKVGREPNGILILN